MTPKPATLFERERPEAALREALAAVRSGRGRCVFLVAPAGLGKTALLDTALRHWQSEGLRLGHAVASPMEMAIPFGLLDRAISMLGGTDAIGEVTNVDLAEPSSSRLYRTMRWLEKACAEAPLLLALDDLHWSDGDSLELLGYLCRRITQLPVAVLATLRPEPDRAHQLVDDLVTTVGASVIALAPLTKHASSALAARTLGRELTDAESEAIWRGAAGTPLLVKTAAEALLEGSPIDTLVRDGNEGLRFVLERFAGVGHEPLAYAKAASVFGVRFRRLLAAQLAHMDEHGDASAHELLVRARLVEDLGGGWSRFVHPLFAQGLFEALPPSTREELHARAFRLLVDAGLPDGEAAGHAYAGALVGDPLAIEISARAGQAAAAQGAFEVAVTHLARALELAGDRKPLALRLAHAGVLVALTRTEEAHAACEEILADPLLAAPARSEVLRLLAQAAFVANHPDDSQRLFEEAAAAVADDPADEGRVLLHAVSTCLVTSKMHWIEAAARRAVELVPATAVEHAPSELLHAYARLIGGDPGGVAVIGSVTTAWHAGSLAVDPASRWAIAFHLQSAGKLLERYEDSARIFESEYERARRDGSPLLMSTMAISHADNLHRLGRAREALDLVDESNALSRYTMTPWYDLARSALLAELDRGDEAAPHLAVLREFVASIPRGFTAIVALWRDLLEGRRLLEAGRPEQASEMMSDARSLSEETGLLHPMLVPWGPFAIEAHLRAGRLELAEPLVDHLDGLARRLDLRWPTAVVALGRAQLAAAHGERDLADGLFAAAIEAHRSTGMPVFCAEALLAYGSHLRRTRRALEARAPLREAVALAESSDSPRVARHALAELAAAGGRRQRLLPSETALTSRETQVAALAAEGHTNAEIAAALYLSVKTVEHHLGRIYQKLGVSSRRALVGRPW